MTENCEYTIISACATARMDDIANLNSEEVFTVREIDELKKYHKQTSLGFFTVKEALIKLISQEYPDVVVGKKEIEISHEKSGKPILVSYPEKYFYMSPSISITHTGETAFAIVAASKWEAKE